MIEKQGKFGAHMGCSNLGCKFTKSVERLFQKPRKVDGYEVKAK